MRYFKLLSVIVLVCSLLAGCVSQPTAELTDADIVYASITEPAPTEPAPTEPAPTEPAPTEPAPTEPAPTEPAPTEPAPTEPAPTEPAPTEPAPTEPAPTEPVPTPDPVPESVTVPILMFHDVKSYAGGTWSMSVENFRSRMIFLLENGYTPVTFAQLVDYVDAGVRLPEKPVCITLDDGYYSNYKNVFPVITELNIPITVFMTCRTVRPAGTPPGTDEKALPKLSKAELREMEASALVHIQSHTYALHGDNTSYSEETRSNVLPLEGESKAEYKEIFAYDCALAEQLLTSIGTWNHLVFSYPNGRSHPWTEEVLRERGYRVSLTTDTGHVNTVRVGDPESLYLLGRYNVNDDTADEALLNYLEKGR